VLCFLLSLSFLFGTQSSNYVELKKSCGEFVQDFYNWYVVKLMEKHTGPAFALALQYKSQLFSPELFRYLKEDIDAQQKVTGVIVGIDFDPFLACQDPGERYIVGDIVRKNDIYLVDIYEVVSGTEAQKPSLKAELSLRDGQWIFVNFHYRKTDLLSVLKLLRTNRQAHPD
jgi:hypothetical protein